MTVIHKLQPLLLPCLLFAPVLTQSVSAQGDIIVRKNGAKIRGIEITEFKHSALKAKKGEREIEVPGHLVASVTWGDLPEQFVIGRAAMNRGDYENATQMFGEAANATERALLKTECEFFQIKAAVKNLGSDQGAAATAAEQAQSWVGANSDHYRVPEALLLTGRALRLAVKGDDAATVLKQLDSRAINEGFGAVWSARAKYELALTLAANNKTGEARTQYQSANSAADNALKTPSGDDAELRTIKILAKIGEGETFLTDKDFQRAESFFHALVRNPDPGLAAAAWAGEGQAIFMQASESKKTEDLRRAQIALARASVLDSTAGDASARANYFLGRCLMELGPDRAGDDYKKHAKAYFSLVVNSYGATTWADKAREALKQ
ncbi:MAG: hypothetical protein NXI31_18920 [bacterium]|nr:hypothetical protein [bacterium]